MAGSQLADASIWLMTAMTLTVFNITKAVEDSTMATSNVTEFSALYVERTIAFLGTDLPYFIATWSRSNTPSNLDLGRHGNSSNRISNAGVDNSQKSVRCVWAHMYFSCVLIYGF